MYKLFFLFFLVMVFSVNSFASTSPFSDVPQGHWAYNALNMLSKAGIVNGYKNGVFNGSKLVTRYELALVLAKSLETLKKHPQLLKTISSSNSKNILKLSNEFGDELSLLGMRCNKLKSELSEIKDNISSLKTDVKEISATRIVPNKKLHISGDSTTKYVSINYDDSTLADFASFYNQEYIEQRIALNFSAKINEGVRGFVRLERYGDWNTSNGDWNAGIVGQGTQGTRSDTGFRTSMALVDITSLKNIDLIRIGRQPVRIGNLLNVSGTYDGIIINKTLFDDPFYMLTVGSFKFNNTNAAVGWTGTTDNLGLDLNFLSVKGDYDDKFIYELYYARQENMQGGLLPNLTNKYNTASTVTEDAMGNSSWLGLSINYNLNDQTEFIGEFSRKSWENTVDLDGNGSGESDDTGFLCGVNYHPDYKNILKVHFMKYNDFFTSIGVTGGSIIRRAEAMGYWKDFYEWILDYNHEFDAQNRLTFRYEDINDDSTLLAGQNADDRNVYTAIYKYLYKPNTNFTLTYRFINTAADSTYSVSPAALGQDSGYIANSVISSLTSDTISDLYQLNLQMDINF